MSILSSNSPIFLPSEIIFEMLSYLPVKSLLRFKCVCKHWNDTTQDFQFICLHYKHAILIMDEKPPPPQTTLDEDEFKVLDRSSLLVEYRKRYFPNTLNLRRYRIRNPAMHQHQILEIPDSGSIIVNMRLVFDPDYQVLKLLSFVYSYNFGLKLALGFEVLDLRNEESRCCWRPIVLNLPQHQMQGESRMCRSTIKHSKQMKVLFALGTCYIMWDIVVVNSIIGIDIVDMVNDTYIGHITFPTSKVYSRDDCILWNGKLALAKVVKDELHVLLLDDDYKQQQQMKWADVLLIIKPPFITREVSSRQEQITVLRVIKFNKLWFWWKKDKEPLCRYHISTKKLNTSRLNRTEISNYVFRRPCLMAFKGIKYS